MEITVKVRFQSAHPRVERYGSNRYLVYLHSEEEDFMFSLRLLLSKYFGVPPDRISFQGKNYQSDFIFEIN